MIISESGQYDLTATPDGLAVDIIQLNGEEITVNVTLDQPGARASVRAVTVGLVDQQPKLTVNLRHKSPETTADFDARALMRGHSHLEFRGLIEIEEGSRQTESFLTHRSLLQDEAGVNPIPSLEIKNNEVKASHAASVTRLNEESLFFLRSRGLAELDAVALLTTAFLASVTEHLEPTWQETIANTIR